MFNAGDIKFKLLKPGQGKTDGAEGAWVHCKTTPYIIFAQGYVGHYELTAAGQRLILKPGDAFFTPPNLPLTITHHPANGKMQMRWLHFNVMLWNGIAIQEMFDFPLKVEKKIANLLAEPIDELYKLETRDDLAATVRKNQMGFQCLDKLLPLLKPRKNMEALAHYSDRILPVIEYIRHHIDRKLTMTEVVAHSGMSRAGLYQLFRQTLNTSPHHYIARLRLDRAAEKLRGSDLTIGEIADMLGYPNQFLLSRHFRKAYAISPSNYRQTQAWRLD